MLSLQCTEQNSKWEALMTLTSKEEKANAAKSCSLQLSWDAQWFLHNHALRQFRTNISDWICKHWLILARGSRGWALHISVSQRVCSGRDRCAIGLDWLHQDCCWGWVQVLGLEEYTLWKHMAHLKTSLSILSGSPAELYMFKVSYKSQMHIAVYSCLIKKWAQMTQQKISW